MPTGLDTVRPSHSTFPSTAFTVSKQTVASVGPTAWTNGPRRIGPSIGGRLVRNSSEKDWKVGCSGVGGVILTGAGAGAALDEDRPHAAGRSKRHHSRRCMLLYSMRSRPRHRAVEKRPVIR